MSASCGERLGARWWCMLVLASAQACTPKPTAPPETPQTTRVPSRPSPAADDCGRATPEYEARTARSGAAAKLPPVPELPTRPLREDDHYTVWGASYSLRSPVYRTDLLTQERVDIVGYITKTNLPEAPRCAVHAGGEADPEDCRPYIPAFWIGDRRDAPIDECIKVMGWASNYAQVYEAIREYDSGNPEYMDTFWGVNVPNPLPAVGAKVLVSGRYAPAFTGASVGVERDDVMGILHWQQTTELEPAPSLATLPGVRRKKQ